MTQLMNAALLTGHGGADKLVYTQVAKPSPQAGEVLIQVGACSVNNTDLNTRTGWYTAEQEFEAVLQDTATTTINTSTGWGQTAIQFPRIQGELIYKDLEMIGATRMEATVFQNLVNYINKNRLKPVVSKTFPLFKIHAAQTFFQSKSFCGKVIITLEQL